MKTLMISAMAALTMAAPALAQSVPDLEGRGPGNGRPVIPDFNPHHPGAASYPRDTPRVREITFTLEVGGQDGRLFWGKSWSSPTARSHSQRPSRRMAR